MPRIGQLLASAIGIILVGIACGDSGGPVVPKAVAASAGNGQIGGPGAAIALLVTVTGTDNQPYAGATVNWAVNQGSANVNPIQSITDAAGQASTNLTLGSVQGSITASATVAGIAPALFTVTMIDPCQQISPYTFGTTTTGALRPADCKIGGFFTDLFGFTVGSQQGAMLRMVSDSFDTWLELYTSGGGLVAVNDDSVTGVTTNSVLNVILAPGDYIVTPTSFQQDSTGPYTLSTAARPVILDGCLSTDPADIVWVTRGVSFSETVDATNCVDTSGPYYSDQVLMFLTQGSVLTVRLASTDFDAFLLLFGTAGLVGTDDDSAGVGPNAYLVATIPSTGVFLLDIGTADTAEVGAYTLSISSSITASAAFRALPPNPLTLLARRTKPVVTAAPSTLLPGFPGSFARRIPARP